MSDRVQARVTDPGVYVVHSAEGPRAQYEVDSAEELRTLLGQSTVAARALIKRAGRESQGCETSADGCALQLTVTMAGGGAAVHLSREDARALASYILTLTD